MLILKILAIIAGLWILISLGWLAIGLFGDRIVR